jgi:hypothetical protein
MGGLGVVRIVILVLGAVALVAGLLLVLGGGPTGVMAGIWLVVTGSILLLAVAFERGRYRSEQAERTSAPPGPGGGETAEAEMEPRFRPTDEVFVDPTSRRRMRVWLDPDRGERRYRAED